MEQSVTCTVNVRQFACDCHNRPTERFFVDVKSTEDEYLIIPSAWRVLYWRPMPRQLTIGPCDGSIWVVTTHFFQGLALLAEGWRAITKHYRIEKGYRLWFEYDMEAHLKMFVFRPNGTEKKWPVIRHAEGTQCYYHGARDFEVTIEELTRTNGNPVRELIERNRYLQGGIWTPYFDFVLWPGVLAPSFEMPLPPAFAHLYLPRGFSDRKLRRKGAGDWGIKCYNNGFTASVLEGWQAFAQDNELAEHDACGVEQNLIDCDVWNIVVLKKTW